MIPLDTLAERLSILLPELSILAELSPPRVSRAIDTLDALGKNSGYSWSSRREYRKFSILPTFPRRPPKVSI